MAYSLLGNFGHAVSVFVDILANSNGMFVFIAQLLIFLWLIDWDNFLDHIRDGSVLGYLSTACFCCCFGNCNWSRLEFMYIFLIENIKRTKQKQKNPNFMAPFHGWGSTASKLELLGGGSLLFTTFYFLLFKFPEIPGTHFVDLGRMKGWVDTRSKLFPIHGFQLRLPLPS